MKTYRFGEFELDLDAQQLRSRGKPIKLERRPFDLLVILVTRHGHLVLRDDIIAALWSNNVIIDFESGLNTLVKKVRTALGDSSDHPRFVETVPGRGYRFIASIDVSATPAPVNESLALSRTRRSRTVATLVIFSLVAVVATFIWQSDVMELQPIRIAVLPFDNLTGDDNLGYLASGIAEEISLSLTRIDLPNLSVVGFVSTKALAESTSPLQQIGREIGVNFFVLSSLRLDQSRIRVTSRLIRVADAEQIWSASFDRELTNVLGLQRELSISIAEQIRQRLSPEVAAAIDRRQTENPEAYALYLRGRFEWTRFQPDSISNALQYYRQAVASDPEYALAWAGIAHALVTSSVTIEADQQSILPVARDALQRALEFGADLAETQLALGSFHFFLDIDLPPAELAARKSVALDPNSAMSYMFLGIVLSERGKHVEARAMLRRARELDPLFPLMFANSAYVALKGGDARSSIEFATQAIAISPEFWVGYLHLGNAQLALGEMEAALQSFANAERYSGGNSARASASRVYLLARLGKLDEARDVLIELMSRSTDRHVPPYEIAVAQAALGDIDTAIEWLGHASAIRNVACFDFADDPRLDPLRTDLRFEPMLERCSLKADRGSAK